MLIYIYRCEQHGEFEVRQRMHEEHKANCPQCGKPAQRVFSSPQWIWKGEAYRPDGTRRPDSDYAPVMKG